MSTATTNSPSAGPAAPAPLTADRRAGATLRSRLLRADAVGVAVCLALGAAAYFAGVEPVINARAGVEQTRRLIEEQSRHADDAERLLAAERAKQIELQRQLAASAIKLDPPGDINRRLAVISEVADRCALTIQALDPGTPTTDPAIGKFALVPIRFSGEGTYADVARFLHELLTVRFADVEVRALSIATATPGAGPEPVPAATDIVGPRPKNRSGERAAFTIDLRWYAAPAASAAAETVR